MPHGLSVWQFKPLSGNFFRAGSDIPDNFGKNFLLLAVKADCNSFCAIPLRAEVEL
jgi:hypothetical protein